MYLGENIYSNCKNEKGGMSFPVWFFFYIFYNLLIKQSYLLETALLTTTAQDISTLTQFDILISTI